MPDQNRLPQDAFGSPQQGDHIAPPYPHPATGKWRLPWGGQAPDTAYLSPPPTRSPQTTRQLRLPPPAPHPRPHWLLLLGIAMLAVLVLWLFGSLALAWGLTRLNDIRYGYPRTYQVDQVVGHGDSPQHPSHFIAINLHRQAVVIELMAGNPARSISYVVSYVIGGQGGDQVPVTLTFRDVTGDSKLDMIVVIHLPTGDRLFVFVNTGQKFRPSTGKDHIHL